MIERTDRDRLVRLENLGILVRARRTAEGLSLEQAAQQTGVSAATLSRWERQYRGGRVGGKRLEPDRHKLAAVASWLGVGIESDDFITAPIVRDTLTHNESQGTVEMIEAHLRADRNLDPDTAAALARMFRVAYEQFSRLHQSSQGDDLTSDAKV